MAQASQTNQNFIKDQEYVFTILEIPNANTDNASIYSVASSNSNVTARKISDKTFGLTQTSNDSSLNTVVTLKINGVNGYDNWQSTMGPDTNPIQCDITYNITRKITPFILHNTSDSTRRIVLSKLISNSDIIGKVFYTYIGDNEGLYTSHTVTAAASLSWNFDIPAGQKMYIYTLDTRVFGSSADDGDGIHFDDTSNFTGIVFGGDIYALSAGQVYAQMFYELFKGTNITNASTIILNQALDSSAREAYYGMFCGCSSLTTPPVLPSLEVPAWGYAYMFQNCSALTTAPELPAITIGSSSYENMFANCTSLTTAPVLNIQNPKNGCCALMFGGCTSLSNVPSNMFASIEGGINSGYNNAFQQMFQGCTSLTTIPVLPSTIDTVSANMCWSMYENCTSLTTIPANALPATKIADSGYNSMFKGCRSLVNIPSGLLGSPTVLASSAYQHMFENCTSLTSTCAFPNNVSSSAYSYMFAGCTSLTTVSSLPNSLAEHCFEGMFQGCTSLTNIPNVAKYNKLLSYCFKNMFKGCTGLTNNINAIFLDNTVKVATYCCESMFENCTSLTKSPVLKPNNLGGGEGFNNTFYGDGCYKNMFKGCTNLNYVQMYAKYPSGYGVGIYQGATTNYYIIQHEFDGWLENVKSTGTLVLKTNTSLTDLSNKNKAQANGDVGNLPSASGSGIPQGWTVSYN